MLRKENIHDIYPLSPMQEGIFYHYLRKKNSPTYFIQNCYRIKAYLEVDNIESSFIKLIERHEVLRTVFTNKGINKLLQIVLKEVKPHFYYLDLSNKSPEECEVSIHNYRENDRENGFDLSKDILMRLAVFQINEDEFEFVWSHHHILMDGWCSGIIKSEFMAIYNHLANNTPLRLPKPIPYSKYIKWLSEQNLTASEQYWKDYIHDVEGFTGCPSYNTGHTGNKIKGDYMFALTLEQTDFIKKIAERNHTTQYVVFQAIWAILLSKYNSTHDVIFGSVVSGRSVPIRGVEHMIGLFLNTLPVRVNVDSKISFLNLLKEALKSDIEGKAHHHFPLSEIKQLASTNEDLFDHILIFENYPAAQVKNDNTSNGDSSNQTIKKIKSTYSFQQTNYNLDVGVIPGPRLLLKMGFNPQMYSLERIKMFTKHFSYLVDQINKNNNISIGELMLTDKEEYAKIQHLSTGKVTTGESSHIVSILKEVSHKHSNKIAIQNKDVQLTYACLDEITDRLARNIRKSYGIREGDRIGVLCDYSENTIISILAIIKSGGVYVPINNTLPKKRLAEIINDAKINLILTTSDYIIDVVEFYNGECFALDLQLFDICDCEMVESSSQSPAYIIYTSGTTGRPKGIVINHNGLTNLVQSQVREFHICPNDTVLQFSSLLFDASISEIFTTLAAGAKLQLVEKDTILNAEKTDKYIRTYDITQVTLPPTVIKNLGMSNLQGLRKLISAGESCRFDEDYYFEKLTYYNAYGPAESTVCSTIKKIISGSRIIGSIPIGKPIDNLCVWVLDVNGNPQPYGVDGEICISGQSIANGYLNEPELTHKAFVTWNDRRMYKTGDIGHWDQNGELVFVGRKDDQIKIRGQRVEPKEVAQILCANKDVHHAVVTNIGEYGLNAFIVLCHEKADLKNKELVLELEELLKKHCAEFLPEYMIPVKYYFIPEIPFTTNGKVDKKALENISNNTLREQAYEPPANNIEDILVKIWEELLDKEKIGAQSNFFELGGHSLNATMLVNKISKELTVEIPLEIIFKKQTIRNLSDYIITIQQLEGTSEVAVDSLEITL